MQLLLTTSHSFLLLDTDKGDLHRLDHGRGLYYGIARHGDKMYVAARNRLVSSDLAQRDERGEILIFNRSLELCGALHAPFPLRDLHEIAWHEGKLWATCSFDNMIAIYDGQEWEKWFPLGVSEGEPSDVNHFNSFLFDGDLVWLLAHNHGDSELLAFTMRSRELVKRLPMGRCGHNIWRDAGQMMTCSSLEGKIMGEQGFRFETGGFPRGVAFSDDTRCVGISELAERGARDLSNGKVMTFDRDWTLRKEISLPGEGLILDLMPLPAGFRPATNKIGKASAWSRLTGFFK